MRKVKGTLRTYGKIAMIIGAFLLAMTVMMLAFMLIEKDVIIVFASFAFGIIGMLWLILGTTLIIRAKRKERKLQHLIHEGLRYDATIEWISSNFRWVRLGDHRSGYMECSYQNQEGKICLIKSDSFLLAEHSVDYQAAVYVNRDNPADYAVEILYGLKPAIHFDYDYR